MSAAMMMTLSAVLMLAAAALLLASVMVDRPTPAVADEQRVVQRIEARLMRGGRTLWRRQTQRRARAAEVAQRLRQAGYVGTRAQVAVLLSLALVAVGLAAVGAVYGLRETGSVGGALSKGVAGALIGAVLGWLWLNARVVRRRERLEDETELLIQTTRMLWETGMTLEAVLRSLILNLGEVLPAYCLELRVALARIEAGQERGEVLESLADQQASPGAEAYFNLLAQVAVSGAAAGGALSALGELLADRRRTTLQERVTKMSGKMSLVMMLFLFPVLLIVVAGPAVVNLAEFFQYMASGFQR